MFFLTNLFPILCKMHFFLFKFSTCLCRTCLLFSDWITCLRSSPSRIPSLRHKIYGTRHANAQSHMQSSYYFSVTLCPARQLSKLNLFMTSCCLHIPARIHKKYFGLVSGNSGKSVQSVNRFNTVLF